MHNNHINNFNNDGGRAVPYRTNLERQSWEINASDLIYLASAVGIWEWVVSPFLHFLIFKLKVSILGVATSRFWVGGSPWNIILAYNVYRNESTFKSAHFSDIERFVYTQIKISGMMPSILCVPPSFEPGPTTPPVFKPRHTTPQFSNQDTRSPVFKPGSTTPPAVFKPNWRPPALALQQLRWSFWCGFYMSRFISKIYFTLRRPTWLQAKSTFSHLLLLPSIFTCSFLTFHIFNQR